MNNQLEAISALHTQIAGLFSAQAEATAAMQTQVARLSEQVGQMTVLVVVMLVLLVLRLLGEILLPQLAASGATRAGLTATRQMLLGPSLALPASASGRFE